MIYLVLILIILAMAPFALAGLLLAWHIARPQRSPADTSNRLNKARLVWFAMTREGLFADLFPWLRRDELDNLKDQVK